MRVQVRFYTLLSLLILILFFQTFPQTYNQTNQAIYPQFNSPLFESISIEDGLPDNSVTCILQDYLGYMWFGTQNGLAKYDGYSMTVYKPDTTNNQSISGSVIINLFEDNNKTLWVGTLNGLNRFSREDESFTSYKFNPNDTNSISSDFVHTIYEDRFGRFWIGTQCGLNLFKRESEKFKRFYFIDSKSKAVSYINENQYSIGITAITEDPMSEDILLGTGLEGLWRFNNNEKQISKFEFKDPAYVNKKLGCIQNFCKSQDGKLWMTTINSLSSLDLFSKEFKCYFDFPIRVEGNAQLIFLSSSVIEDQYGNIAAGFFGGEKGLIYLNPNSGEINIFELIPSKAKNTMLNMINDVYEDRSGIIWIGTFSTGVKKWERYENNFSVVQSNTLDENNLSSPKVYSVICDPKGYTWYCTPKGLDRYDQRTHRYTHYLKDEKCVTDFMVYVAMIDHSGNLWLGTSNCGLVKFNPQNSTYRFDLNNPNKLNLIDKTVLCLLQDHLGYIWIGTRGFGIYKYDPRNGHLDQYKNDPTDSLSLSQNEVLSILEDHDGNLWVGTNSGGLNKFNRETGKFSYAGFYNCLSLYEDSENRFWVAEYLTGLNLFDTEKLKVTANFSRDNGLASNSNIGVIEDDYKNLWFVSDAGISRVNPETKKVKNFVIENKLSNVFNLYMTSCTGKGTDGRMYINTRKGLVIFNPASVNDDPTPPQLVISNISLFNRPEEKLDFTGFIPESKEINLPYDFNDLRFDYVGLQYNEPLKNTYKYMLENFDRDWVEAGTQRNATYTNLNPGEYIFRVKAANRDDVWSTDDASIKIIILPPWWKTPLAYIFYVLTIFSLIYFTLKLQLRRIRIKQGYEMSRFEAEKLHEVDELKTKFFTNISHEFRTPLTLILGPAKHLLEQLKDEEAKSNADLIHRSAKKLNRLVDELLDISKIESGEMKLKACPVSIASIVNEIARSFYSLAERKKITFNLNSEVDELIVYVDVKKIDKILTNVISNAFKFTPEGGQVDVVIHCQAELVSASSFAPKIPIPIKSERNDSRGFVEISIRDTGIGIPKDQIDKIFNRFYQVDGSHTREKEGTGIGLSLTKELVELHKGRIEVESEPGKGSIFKIIFLLGKNHLKPEEICVEKLDEDIVALSFDEFNDLKKEHKIDIDISAKTEKPSLLIVEDNSDVREYIIGILDHKYNILEAKDGEEGVRKSYKHIPDLIISDIMMPKLDGFQLCQKLKSDSRTSHIPIIMLTAKATLQDKINGLETGADDYIMKPFEAEELKARIKNLLDQRKKMHEHFRMYGLADIDEKRITSLDQKFLQKAIDIVSKHISDTAFGVEVLAEGLSISRSLLLKKTEALFGESPNDLIRRIRLNKAARLIERNFGNISEIALEVGFSNPSYFAECFKKQFGVVPSHYHFNNSNT